eukprot:CAMPEP_0197521406 /NCGR_PEP_ID=MMETSP1318-20131121/6683_1 /TAXON_ID=552666 /ORGANISM="Partenskyella glossopodia, Strain RCC365" /LENGTH=404 /DNA_ID=CAMNT_0043073395 /DNA_START=241 /DNA_END=1455 /DNA_ORIENTATION=+
MRSSDGDTWAHLGQGRKLEPKEEKNNGQHQTTTTENHAALDPNLIQYEGWVEKQSRYLKTWRHRWVVLVYPCLYSFKSRQQYDSIPTEEIDLRTCRISPNPIWTSQLGPHGFDVVCGYVTFSFRTRTRQEKFEWVTAIMSAIATRGEEPRPQPRPNPQQQQQQQQQQEVDAKQQQSAQALPASQANNTGGGANYVDDAIMEQVLRESALEAGVEYTPPSRVDASTALRISQDEEYERSLEEDMRREREEKEQQQQQQQQEAETKHPRNIDDSKHNNNSINDTTSHPNHNHANHNHQFEHHKEDSKSSSVLPKESKPTPPAPEPALGPNVCTCQIRLSTGKRLLRRFHKKDTIKTLKNYVRFASGLTNDFDLVSNFPRKVWNNVDLTLQQTKLGPKCSFFVQESE